MVLFSAVYIHAESKDGDNVSGNNVNDVNYICEGTVWESAALVLVKNDEAQSILDLFQIIHIRTWAEGTETINGRNYLNIYSGVETNDYQDPEIFHIRTESDKVIILNEKDPNDITEEILYDFSIGIGEEIEIPCILGGGKTDGTSTVKLLEINQEVSENISFETYIMDISLDGYRDENILKPIKWIKGIGSNAGLLSNVIGPESGGDRLLSVHHNGELVYEYTGSSDIRQILDSKSNSANGKKYHIDGSEFHDGDTGIYIQNGRKFYKAN